MLYIPGQTRYNKIRKFLIFMEGKMNLKDVQRVLKAKILVGEELMERPVETCCGSDLMSDVLAFT